MGLLADLKALAALVGAAERDAKSHEFMANWSSGSEAADEHRAKAEAARQLAEDARVGAKRRIRQEE